MGCETVAERDLANGAVAEQQRYLTAFFSPAPALNFGTLEAAM